MSDLDTYLTRCYNLMFKKKTSEDDAELCACANLVKHEDQTH